MLRDFGIFYVIFTRIFGKITQTFRKNGKSHTSTLYGKGSNVHGASQNVTPVKQWRSQDCYFDSREVESHPMFWSIFLKTAQKRKKINHRQLVHVHVNTPQTMYYISNDKFCKRLKLRF